MQKRFSAQTCVELLNLKTWHGVEISLPTAKMADYLEGEYRSSYAWKLACAPCEIPKTKYSSVSTLNKVRYGKAHLRLAR